MYGIWGFIKKPRPFNHIFGGDWILRAWYRGIKNAGPRKRAQGRAQDIPYQSIPPYHHGIWRIFIECGKNPTRARARKGEAQGVLSYQQATGIFDNPHILTRIWFDFLSQMKAKKKNYTWNSLLHHLALKGIRTDLDSPVQKPPAKSTIQPSSPVVEDSEKLNGRRALLVLGVPSLRTQRQRQPLPPLASGGLREPLNKALLLWGGRECLGGTLRFPWNSG